MHRSNLRKIDLNLLIALDVLLEELHISRSAQRLNLSQPAMSRVLSRLRETLNDPLLVRAPEGYCRTPRADALISPVRSILNDIEQALVAPEFDPTSYSGEFRICTLDYGEVVLVPEIMELVASASDQIGLRIVHRATYDSSEIEDGKADLLIGILPDTISANCQRKELFEDEYVCVMHRNHPLANKVLTLDDYLEFPHSIIGNGNDRRTAIDLVLEQTGHKRKVTKISPHFVASVMSMGETRLIQTIPRLLAEKVAGAVNLVVKETPIDFGSIKIGSMWHSRNTNDPTHSWFRQQVELAAKVARSQQPPLKLTA